MALNPRMTEWVTEKIPKLLEPMALGEEVSWDLMLGPGPNGPALIIVVSIPGAVLGTNCMGQVLIDNPFALKPEDDENLTAFLQGAFDFAREQRSQQLAQANGNGNGPHPGLGGLHAP